jgi:hypothetical protein
MAFAAEDGATRTAAHNPADGSAGRSAPTTTSASPPGVFPAGPLTFGDYEVVAELGEGGMGRVYKAVDRKLGRFVAVKVLRTPDEFEASRFRGEAEITARLDHPNITSIFEIETTPDGRPYLVLEFAEGGSLDRELRGQPQEPRRAAEAAETLARAIQYAHEQGVIHRDLKPANVLRAKDGTLKLTDFGLAKQYEVASGLTPSGAVMGTPSYMAPEQAAGSVREVGPAADIYGLGAILYELLTGRPPFRGVNMVETLEQVRWSDPAPPSRLVPRLHKDLGTICLKCLAKTPARRYRTAGDLATDLRRWLDGETIAARPAPAWERAWRQIRRRPWEAATIAAAVLLILALLAGLIVWQRQDAERVHQEELRAADKQLHAEKERAAAAFQTDQERNAVRLRERGQKSLAALDGIRALLVTGKLRGTPGLQPLTAELARYYKDLVQEQLADPGADRVALGHMTFQLGELLDRDGDRENARWAFSETARLYDGRAEPEYRARRAEARGREARAAFDLGREDEACALADDAHGLWSALEREAADPSPARDRATLQLAEVWHLRGEVFSRRYNLGRAADAFRASIKLRERVAGEIVGKSAEELSRLPTPAARLQAVGYLRDLGRGHGYLGDTLLDLKDIGGADRAYWESHHIRDRVAKALGSVPPRTPDESAELETARFQLGRSWMNLAGLQTRHRAQATARHFAETALKIREQLVQASPNNIEYRLDLCDNWNQMAELILLDPATRDRATAQAYLDQAVKLADQGGEGTVRGRQSLAESHALRAALAADRGEAARALALLDGLARDYPDQPLYPFRQATMLALGAKLDRAAPDDPRWQAALDRLGRAVELRFRGKHPDVVRDLPVFEPVRSDPRFLKLIDGLRD